RRGVHGRADRSAPRRTAPVVRLWMGPTTSPSGGRPLRATTCPGGTKLRGTRSMVAGVVSPGGPAAAASGQPPPGSPNIHRSTLDHLLPPVALTLARDARR